MSPEAQDAFIWGLAAGGLFGIGSTMFWQWTERGRWVAKRVEPEEPLKK